eukprot:3465378-Rhodomonas_salina.1
MGHDADITHTDILRDTTRSVGLRVWCCPMRVQGVVLAHATRGSETALISVLKSVVFGAEVGWFGC